MFVIDDRVFFVLFIITGVRCFDLAWFLLGWCCAVGGRAPGVARPLGKASSHVNSLLRSRSRSPPPFPPGSTDEGASFAGPEEGPRIRGVRCRSRTPTPAPTSSRCRFPPRCILPPYTGHLPFCHHGTRSSSAWVDEESTTPLHTRRRRRRRCLRGVPGTGAGALAVVPLYHCVRIDFRFRVSWMFSESSAVAARVFFPLPRTLSAGESRSISGTTDHDDDAGERHKSAHRTKKESPIPDNRGGANGP